MPLPHMSFWEGIDLDNRGVILGKIQMTGEYSSANFFSNAGPKAAEESNAENLLVIHDRKLAERYIKNWEEHEKHSEVYLERGR